MSDAPPLPPAVSTYLRRKDGTKAHVTALTGDASTRRYFRVVPNRGSPFVLALYAEPFEFESHPFATVTALLSAMPVPVPRILGHAGDLGILELEDLGDVSLQLVLATADDERRGALYREAVELIARLQRRGKDLEDQRLAPYQLAFDVTKLSWELDFFTEHFLEAYRGAALRSVERKALRDEYLLMTQELASEPRVLCHRDFHSRNLMLRGDHLVIIDHQDARMGPDTYDLASLLRDAYVEVSDTEAEQLIDHFVGLRESAVDTGAFRTRFDLMALQRNLKALGTFGHQATTLQNRAYVEYIDRVLSLVRRALTRHRRFGRLGTLLSTHLEELR